MKYYMNITRLATEPLTSNDLHEYSDSGWDLVTVKPDWSRQPAVGVGYGGNIASPKYETWIFSKESKA